MPTTQALPPGPVGHWLTGCLKEFSDERLDFFTRCAKEYGDICSFRLGRRRMILVNHSDLIERVLVNDAKHYIKHFGARNYWPVLGNGLVLSEGDFWLRQRRLSQPAFSRQRLIAYSRAMVEVTERFIADWKAGSTFNIDHAFSNITSAIALKTLFGLDEQGDREEFLTALREVFDLCTAKFRRLIPWPHWVPLPSNLRLRRGVRKLDAVVDGFIQQVRQRETAEDDLLTTLIQARDEDGSRMSDQQLRDEAMTLYLAGHETTALALSWTWYLLAQHPDIEERLAEEWRTVLGGRAPTFEDIPRLTLTGHVITEGMRLYPPVYIIGREATRDLELGGYPVPRGTTVFMSQWVTHRDERYFPEPLKFQPDRWADGLAERLPKFAYFPFGGGPRVCIGNQFAMIEAVLVLATIGQRWHFTLNPEPKVELWPSITLLPQNGIGVTLKARA